MSNKAGGANAPPPVSSTPMPTLASDAFIVDDDSGMLLDSRYRAPARKPRSDAAARKAGFTRLAALSAAVAMGGDVDDAEASPDAAAGPTKRGYDGGDHSSFKSINPHQRTMLEQNMLDRVPERRKAGLVKTQTFAGKVYTGPGFLSDPTVVSFQDFVVGKPMTITVTVTNVSNGFNIFKLGKIPSAIVDCIEVQYAPGGLLSAGLSTKLTVIFTPKEDIDIDSVIPLLAQTGPVEIPLQCRRRRTVIDVSNQVLEFESVVVAEKAVRKLTISNRGALPTKVTIRGDGLAEALKLTHTPPPTPASGPNPAPVPVLTVAPADKAFSGLFVPAFGAVTIAFTFTPFQVCNFDLNGFLTFDSDDAIDQPFFLRGAAVDVPVYIERNRNMSLGCCCEGVLYRDKFSVRNTTSASVQVKPEVPPLLRGVVEFVPPFGFAQPGPEGLEFQVRFVPNAVRLAKNKDRVAAIEQARLEEGANSQNSDDDAGRQVRSADATAVAAAPTPSLPESPTPAAVVGPSGDIAALAAEDKDAAALAEAALETICTDDKLQVPVRVRVLGQSMPLFLILRAELSSRRLLLEPNAFHFPQLSPAEAVTRKLTIFNDSRLFRQVGFVKVPNNIHISPTTSRVRLAPGERYAVDVTVNTPPPAAAGLQAADAFRQQLQLLTEQGETFYVTVSGTLRQPPLVFSAGSVALPRCAVNDAVSASVSLTNVTSTVQSFAFAPIMKRYGLRVSPPSGDVAPGSSITVVVSFEGHPAIALPIVIPEANDIAEDGGDGATPAPTPAPPASPGGKAAAAAPAAKKKTKAEEEAERIAKLEQEAARAARVAKRAAQREQALKEIALIVPWTENLPTESVEQRLDAHNAVIASLTADAQQQSAAGSSAGADPPAVVVAAAEPWSRHRTVRLPCFVEGFEGKAIFLSVSVTLIEPLLVVSEKPAIASTASRTSNAASAAVPTTGSAVVDLILQESSTAEGLPLLSGSDAPVNAGHTVRFGSVPSMATVTRTLHLHCRSARPDGRPMRIAFAPLDPYGPFSIVKPPTALTDVGQRCEVTIAFRPAQKARYGQRVFLIVDDVHRAALTCLGEGLPTSLAVSVLDPAAGKGPAAGASAKGAAAAGKGPAAATVSKTGGAASTAPISPGAAATAPGTERVAGDGVATIDAELGHCLVGETVEATIVFENQSPFPLHINTTFDSLSISPRNPNGTAPFSVTPSVFTVQANSRVEGVVAFHPACQSPFTATALISYGGAEATKRLCLSGFGWNKGAFVQFPRDSNAPSGLLAMLPPARETPIAAVGGSNTTAATVQLGTAAALPGTSDSPFSFFAPRFDPTALVTDPYAAAIGATPQCPIEVRFTTTASVTDAADASPAVAAAPSVKGAEAVGPAVAAAQTRTIVVGAVPTSTSAEVTVDGLTDADARAGWKVDAQKVTIAAGQRVAIGITFAPTSVVLDTLPLRRVAVVSSAQLRVTIKGGAPATDATYFLRLMGTVQRQ